MWSGTVTSLSTENACLVFRAGQAGLVGRGNSGASACAARVPQWVRLAAVLQHLVRQVSALPPQHLCQQLRFCVTGGAFLNTAVVSDRDNYHVAPRDMHRPGLPTKVYAQS